MAYRLACSSGPARTKAQSYAHHTGARAFLHARSASVLTCRSVDWPPTPPQTTIFKKRTTLNRRLPTFRYQLIPLALPPTSIRDPSVTFGKALQEAREVDP